MDTLDVLSLLPNTVPLRLQALRLEVVQENQKRLHLELTTIAKSAQCSLCSQPAVRVHSRYQRTLNDLPCSAAAVQLKLCVRKFFCDNPHCARRVFTEPLPTLAARWARRTLRLQTALRHLGLALGGEAGARLGQDLQLITSPDTLLRVLRRGQSVLVSTPRVLGVDDFALCRGRTYGTILVDLERHRVVALLPDRQAQTLADWLKQHPGTEVISRDRAAVYAQGARQGAPHALQVADRWHLLKNLTETLESLLLREHRAVRQAAHLPPSLDHPSSLLTLPHSPVAPQVEGRESSQSCAVTKTVTKSLSTSPQRLARREQEQAQRRARRLMRYEQIRALSRQGMTLRGIAETTRISRSVVHRFVQAPEFPERAVRSWCPSKLAPFYPYLQRRWEAGCQNAAQLTRELQAQGYLGGQTLVKEYLRTLRSGAVTTPTLSVIPLIATTPTLMRDLLAGPSSDSRPVPATRTVLWWLLRPDEALDPAAQQFLPRLCRISPCLGLARELALWFFRMTRERRASEFGDWIAAVRDSGVPHLQGFAKALLRDRAAVVAGLSQEWSNGQTEGQVNRLKLIKRQMYGRAGFDLLQARVLTPA